MSVCDFYSFQFLLMLILPNFIVVLILLVQYLKINLLSKSYFARCYQRVVLQIVLEFIDTIG
jgi:hypothetical protein